MLTRRHWRFAQLLAKRPAAAPEAKLLAARGARWRRTISALVTTHHGRSQGHGRRDHWLRWDQHVDAFVQAHSPNATTWEDEAETAGARWLEAEHEFLRWRLAAWEGRCTIPLVPPALTVRGVG